MILALAIYVLCCGAIWAAIRSERRRRDVEALRRVYSGLYHDSLVREHQTREKLHAVRDLLDRSGMA